MYRLIGWCLSLSALFHTAQKTIHRILRTCTVVQFDAYYPSYPGTVCFILAQHKACLAGKRGLDGNDLLYE